MPVQSSEEGELKRSFLISTVLLSSLLALALFAGGCDVVTGQVTTATLREADADSIAADTAIAAVTPSGDIKVPASIQAGVLRAGCDVAFPPLSYLAVVGEGAGEEATKVTKPVGFEVDLCTAVAKKLGLTLEVVQIGWDDIVPALVDDQIDIIMSAMLITPELEQEVGFTDPHLDSVLAISAPLNAPVTDLAGLAGKTVGVQIDTLGHSQMLTTTGVAEIKTYSNPVEAFADLVEGRIQAVVNDEIVSTYIIDNDPDLKAAVANSGTITTGTGFGFATKKEDTALLAALNAALAELRAEGVYQKICAKWDVTGN